MNSDSTKCPLATARVLQCIIFQDKERQAVRGSVSHALHRADGRQGERLRGRHDQEPRRGPRRRPRGPLQEDLDVRAVETGSKMSKYGDDVRDTIQDSLNDSGYLSVLNQTFQSVSIEFLNKIFSS